MLLNLPKEESPEGSELKRKVSTRTHVLAKSILKQLQRTAHSKTAFQVPPENEILQHAPITSRAYLPPKTTTIPKTALEDTTPQADDKIPSLREHQAPKPNDRDRKYKFTQQDDLMVTVQKIFSPQKSTQYLQWISEELPKEQDVPSSLVHFVKTHLPKKIVLTYKVIEGSQTNLRTDKNFVIQRTSNQGPMPASEISIHRPMDLMENIFKFQELNILRECQVDKEPLKEFIIKTSRPMATATSKSLATSVNIRHNMILALMPEETVVIPKEQPPTPEPPTPEQIAVLRSKKRKRQQDDQGINPSKRLQFVEVEPTKTRKTPTKKVDTEESDSDSSSVDDLLGFD